MIIPYAPSMVVLMAKTNDAYFKTPVVSGLAQDEELNDDIINPDHSRPVIRDSNAVIVELGAFDRCVYVFISGHDAYRGGTGVNAAYANIYDDTTLLETYTIESNGNLFLVVPPDFRNNISNLKIEINNNQVGPNNSQMVSFIAAGDAFYKFDGVHSGYKYLTEVPKKIGKTSLNGQTAPVASLKEYEPMSGKLQIPNMTLSEFSEVKQIMETSQFSPIALKEISSKNGSGVLCFDFKFDMKKHGETASLWDWSARYKAFTGF